MRTGERLKNKKGRRFIIIYCCAVCILGTAACIGIKTLGLYMVVGESMYDTLPDGELVCTKSNFTEEDLTAGTIVCIKTDEDKTIIKRIVAVGGDTVSALDGWLYINGKAYIYSASTEDFGSFTLAEDEYYVLGDNIDVSRDSRYYGPFTFDDIEAIVTKSLFKGEIY